MMNNNSTGSITSQPRTNSLIRKRPVSFGNPVLGTYRGCIYTLDVIGDDYSPLLFQTASTSSSTSTTTSTSLLFHHQNGSSGNGSGVGSNRNSNGTDNDDDDDDDDDDDVEVVERVVAMVDVPPEQVPEGILNLARSHRPFIHHVRIVTTANTNETLSLVLNNNNPAPAPAPAPPLVVVKEDETKNEEVGSPVLVDVKSTAAVHVLDEKLQSTCTATTLEAATITQPSNPESSSNSSSNNNNIISNSNSTSNNYTSGDNDDDDDDDDTTSNQPSRTYVVLLELCSTDAAEALVEDLHGKPFTSLDPTQTCSVFQVLALTGEDGVSLLSPFFAPTAKSTTTTTTTTTSSPKSKTNQSKNNDPLLVDSSSQAALHQTTKNVATVAAAAGNGKSKVFKSKNNSSNGKNNNNNNKSLASTTPAAAATASSSITAPIVEDYNCAVCLERMILSETDNNGSGSTADARSSILTTVCNHTFHLECLMQWQDSPCPVCRYDHSGLNEALSQCNICGTTENNYVCLICGMVSCGGVPMQNRATPTWNATGGPGGSASAIRAYSPVCGRQAPSYQPSSTRTSDANTTNTNTLEPSEISRRLSQSHARKHYDESLHAYALDTETQHVWDFAGQGYIHRLLQNKEDGKLVEFHHPSNSSSHERTHNPGLSEAQEGEVVHRKLEGFASQYYTLLKSQLEQQRSYYQGRLEELRRESFMIKKAQTSDLITALKQEKAQSTKRLASLRARHRKVSDDIGFLKNMNESLETNREPLKRKIQEAQRERMTAKEKMQQELPVLQEQVTMLMLKLTGESVEDPTATDMECALPRDASHKSQTREHSDSSSSNNRKPAAKP